MANKEMFNEFKELTEKSRDRDKSAQELLDMVE